MFFREDAGGFCGSWSIQRAVMAKGAWISQQQVRNHTVAGGGHDEESLGACDGSDGWMENTSSGGRTLPDVLQWEA